MPRPGPRPYECVRRAWHSDRHQPMRGSIIQQIFKVVYENHSAVTKKNKEWQDKLPIVVLKAEEILYSKANSEAEYMDIATLWDRVNDAIDTIIRKDESTETGELLPPCVEGFVSNTPEWRDSPSEVVSNCVCRSSSTDQQRCRKDQVTESQYLLLRASHFYANGLVDLRVFSRLPLVRT